MVFTRVDESRVSRILCNTGFLPISNSPLKVDIPAFFSGMSDIHYGNDILKHIAVVNVKKSGGKANSSMEEINQYAEYDSEELKKELEIIDPTVIVCGYTISSLNIIMGTEIKDYDSPNENWFYSTQLNEHDVRNRKTCDDFVPFNP